MRNLGRPHMRHSYLGALDPMIKQETAEPLRDQEKGLGHEVSHPDPDKLLRREHVGLSLTRPLDRQLA